ncbi:MAG: hypothetical protein MJZ96_01750 [Paludibacteraceae bacterium]|nr:hypothetical protein [Paludibacteraceae bacterium]
MKGTINQRLKELQEFSQLSRNQFSIKCGCSTTPFYQSETSERIPNFATIQKVLEAFPEVSAEWLIRGTGEMLLGKNTEEKNEDLDALKKENERQRVEIVRLNKIIASLAASIAKLK